MRLWRMIKNVRIVKVKIVLKTSWKSAIRSVRGQTFKKKASMCFVRSHVNADLKRRNRKARVHFINMYGRKCILDQSFLLFRLHLPRITNKQKSVNQILPSGFWRQVEGLFFLLWANRLNWNDRVASFYYRYIKAEEIRHKREVDFQIKQIQLENERRRSEREHEMNVLRLILSDLQHP